MIDDDFNVQGKHILVTGGSSGIGRQIAIYLASQGAVIALNGRNTDGLNQTLQRMDGKDHYAIPADLLHLEDTAEVFDSCLNKHGKLDGMVYCAGVIPTIPLQATTIDKLSSAMQINFFAFVDMVRNYSKRRYSDAGSIVGISSIASVTPEKGQIAYASSKAAMNAAVRVMAQELLTKGIRVNVVLPGIAEPEGGIKGDLDILHNQLMGPVDPAYIARMVAFLICDASKFISGRQMFVDGLRI